jgi:hypothetical protein
MNQFEFMFRIHGTTDKGEQIDKPYTIKATTFENKKKAQISAMKTAKAHAMVYYPGTTVTDITHLVTL